MIKFISQLLQILYLKIINIFLTLLLLSSLHSCTYQKTIYAKNYNFNSIYKNPKPGKHIRRLSKSIGDPIINIYEVNKKYSRINPVYKENYGYNNYNILIMYFYKQMIKQDDIMSENELLPIIINAKNGKIIGAGWHFTDSIKKTSYLERLK